MSLFKSKSDKEIEKRMLVRKTINEMNKQIDKLEQQKKVFIEKATEAKKKGLESQYSLAITGYKMTAVQQKRAQEMLLNFEITSQMKDMTMMTSQFLGGMSVLSKEMSKLADSKEFVQVQKEFERAMVSAEDQAERIDAFMEMSKDTFSNQHVGKIEDSNDDIEKMIAENVAQSDIAGDSVEDEIEALRKKIDSMS